MKTPVLLTAILLLATLAAAGAQPPDTLEVGQARIWALTGDHAYDHSPFWSPSGDTIAFVRGPLTGGARIWIKASDGSGVARQATFGDGEFDDWYPDFAPDGRRLCFSSDRGGESRIWTASLDGGEPVPVTGPLGQGHRNVPPTWSPDGSRIAYSAVVDGNRDIYTVPVEGGTPRRITTDPLSDDIPAWSPDGGTIVYTSDRQQDHIWLIPATGGTARSIPTGKIGVTSPKYSPDGRWIAFRAGAGTWHTWIIAADGGEPVAVTVGDSLQGWMADWSPDGTRLAYTRGRRGGWGQLSTVPAGGGTPRALVDSVATFAAGPAWSPDGSRIAFLDLTRNLLAADVASGFIDTLVAVKTHNWLGTPAWSPDGTWIAFCSQRLSDYNVWIAPVDGGEAEAITLGPGVHAIPVWSPDGETIYYGSAPGGSWDVWSTSVWGDPPTPVLTDPKVVDIPVSVLTETGELLLYSDRKGAPPDTVEGYWALSLDGRAPRRLFPVLFPGPGNGSSHPSADGTVAVDAEVATGSIWLRDPVGSPPRLVVTDEARAPRLSPDGKHVAYIRFVTGTDIHDIYLADVRRIVGPSMIP